MIDTSEIEAIIEKGTSASSNEITKALFLLNNYIFSKRKELLLNEEVLRNEIAKRTLIERNKILSQGERPVEWYIQSIIDNDTKIQELRIKSAVLEAELRKAENDFKIFIEAIQLLKLEKRIEFKLTGEL